MVTEQRSRQRERREPSEPQEERRATEEEIAAAIAAMFLAPGAPPAGAVAALLLRLVPSYVPDELRKRVAFDAASFVPANLPEPSGGIAVRAARRDNLLYRAHYAIAALRRLSEAVRAPARDDEGAEPPNLERRLRDALKAEERFFGQHREAARRRVAGAKMNDAAAEKYGPVLGWVHLKTAKTHRPEHERAGGKNYDIRRPPVSTGGLPAVLPGCDCVAGPPHPNAEMLR